MTDATRTTGSGLRSARRRRLIQFIFVWVWCMLLVGASRIYLGSRGEHPWTYLLPLGVQFLGVGMMYFLDEVMHSTDGILSYHDYNKYTNYVPTTTLTYTGCMSVLILGAVLAGSLAGTSAGGVASRLASRSWTIPLFLLVLANVVSTLLSFNAFDASQSQSAWSPANRRKLLKTAWGLYLTSFHTFTLAIGAVVAGLDAWALIAYLLVYWSMCYSFYFHLLDMFTYARFQSSDRDHPDVREYFRIRQRVYVSAGFIPAVPAVELERDEWDDDPETAYLLVYNKGVVVGGIRVVSPSKEHLPIGTIEWIRERLASLGQMSSTDPLPPAKVVELSRLIVLPEFTGALPRWFGSRWLGRGSVPRRSLTTGLFQLLINELARRGVRFAVCTSVQGRLDYYRAVGARELWEPDGSFLPLVGYALSGKWMPMFWDFEAPETIRLLYRQFGVSPKDGA